jgi:hypothetical protein
MLAPSYAAAMRTSSRAEIFQQIWERCRSIAPPPHPDWHDEAGWASRDAAV